MDPLSALAIAAAVFQFIDLGGKALTKGCKKYTTHQQQKERDTAEEAKEREKALEHLAEELIFVSEIQRPSVITTSQPATLAQKQLLQTITDCQSISVHIDEVLGRVIEQIKDNSDSKSNADERRHRRTFRNSKSRALDAPAPFTSDEIRRIEDELQLVRRKAIDSVILCLWDDSKQTKQWELHFSKQLDAVVDLLGRVEKMTKPAQADGKAIHPREPVSISMENLEILKNGSEIGILSPTGMETANLKEALLPLVETGRSIPLKNLGQEIVTSVSDKSKTMAGIHSELVEFLWRKDWKLDMSIPGASATSTRPNIDTTMVAYASRAGIQFDVIGTREEAITKSFASTYTWILKYDPSEQDGKPMWESFVGWLEDNSNKVYWITGKPGSGKSTMMKFLLQQKLLRDALSKTLGSLHLIVLRFYAWHSGEGLQKSFEGLKRTLIFQVLEDRPELTPILAPRRWALCQVLRNTSGLPTWKIWEVEDAWDALLSECGKTLKIALFIDGLDEFDIPPTTVITQLREIVTRCPIGLKVCAASRPWNEFNDEFNDGPMLEMHLLTQGDMTIFVTQKLKGSRALMEQEQLNPEATTQLVREIVQRANGVFLWTSIVVPHLLDLLTDGQSIAQARKALEDLPTHLRNLYKAIWARIREENLSNGSFSMQIVKAAGGPFPWFTMWLVEELRSGPIKINALFGNNNHLKDIAKVSLKRKLAGNTKGILEVNAQGTGFVDFIHRTARDWAADPEIWSFICRPFKGHFDPHLCILGAETLIMSDRNPAKPPSPEQMWDAVVRAFGHASQVADVPENKEELIRFMDSLEAKVTQLQGLSMQAWANTYKSNDKSSHQSSQANNQHTFLELAAQFAILAYIKAKSLSGQSPRFQQFSSRSLGLLEGAIFGRPHHQTSDVSQIGFRPEISGDLRLATVKYLLEQGVYQPKIHSRRRIRELRQKIREEFENDPEYYGAVEAYLDDVDCLKAAFTSIPSRFTSRVRYLIGED
ncbi:hypothetical protein B0J13DRAFT_480574 [Dactylonectria estremocensis]|uniref:Nephrocystin 3-like N-terminal domain-containing protein n=1 Tax=Dactylonectria estremocensis TaxID=1079267 RepID=A0A9P9E9E8_9HYPO|nr:hypothetical protein B0J13DRAFT_480574 [Dactylonectria estremocensis]